MSSEESIKWESISTIDTELLNLFPVVMRSKSKKYPLVTRFTGNGSYGCIVDLNDEEWPIDDVEYLKEPLSNYKTEL